MELEKRGVPTVTLATNEFEQLARLQARAMGYGDLRIVTIPHPLGGTSAEEALNKAGEAATAITQLILGDGGSQDDR